MGFRESCAGQTLLRLPGSEWLLSMGETLARGYYWLKYKEYRSLPFILWASRQSRDDLSRRALTNRLNNEEQGEVRSGTSPMSRRPAAGTAGLVGWQGHP